MLALLFLLAQLPPVEPVQAPAASALRAPLPAPPPAPTDEGPVLPLGDALHTARAQAPDLALAAERVVQAQDNVERAWAALRPTLNAQAGYAYNSVGNLSFKNLQIVQGSHSSETASLNFAWNLLNLRAFPALSSARQQAEVARLGETQSRRELLLQVATTYYSGAALRELSLVARRQALATHEHAREAEARYQAGTIQLSGALRARIDALRADQEVLRAGFSYAAAKSQLAALLDRHDTAFELAPPEAPPEELRAPFRALLEQALRERPEMAAARAGEEIAARLKTDAWYQFLPTLGFSANARYADPATSGTGDKGTWGLALALTVPLYDGGFRYVALKDADSSARQAKAQTRGQASRIEDELRRAELDVASARALREEAEQGLSLARENERLVRAQFSAGTATQVEVSDAEAALFQGESNALQQRLSVQLAALRVAKAIGAFDEGGSK